ncbi:hypothetical protein HispidOSU_021806, partial [Sigmodon hispidus]
ISPVSFDPPSARPSVLHLGHKLATAYCRQLEPMDVDHRGAQQTFSTMEEQGASSEHLSYPN